MLIYKKRIFSFLLNTLIFLCLGAFSAGPISAQSEVEAETSRCAIPPILRADRPDPAGKPTVLEIALTIMDVTEVQETSQSFTVDFFGVLNWDDPRLSEEALGYSLEGCAIHYTEIWNPGIVMINSRQFERYFEQTGRVDNQGSVAFLQRLTGTFTADYHLHDFPFDTQILPIKIRSTHYGPNEVVFQFNDELSSVADDLSLPGWHIHEGERGVKIESLHDASQKLAGFDYTLIAERKIGYYVWKIFLPLLFIVLMAWTVFWINPENFGAQVAVSTASVFTLIAFLLGLGQLLPELSYLTKLDKLVFAATLMVFLGLGETIVTSQCAQKGQRELAHRIDKTARVVYPIVFLIAAALILSL